MAQGSKVLNGDTIFLKARSFLRKAGSVEPNKHLKILDPQVDCGNSLLSTHRQF